MARPSTAILTPPGVVDAAIEIIGADGLENFSMSKLGRRLGVSAPSLYHHFADKDALLAAVARTVATPATPPAAPAPDTEWTDYLLDQAVVLRRRICAHPHCAPLLVRFMPARDMFAEYESTCRYLRASGVPTRLHVPIVDGLTALTIGAAFLAENAAHYTVDGAGLTPDRAAHPNLCDALDTLHTSNPDEQFRTYLRIYLNGILDPPPPA